MPQRRSWSSDKGSMVGLAIFAEVWLAAPVAEAMPIAPAPAVIPAAGLDGFTAVRGGYGWGNRHWIHRERGPGRWRLPRHRRNQG
jgi:hypothetical protein